MNLVIFTMGEIIIKLLCLVKLNARRVSLSRVSLIVFIYTETNKSLFCHERFHMECIFLHAANIKEWKLLHQLKKIHSYTLLI